MHICSKYHSRALVFNSRNLIRLWDIAYDGCKYFLISSILFLSVSDLSSWSLDRPDNGGMWIFAFQCLVCMCADFGEQERMIKLSTGQRKLQERWDHSIKLPATWALRTLDRHWWSWNSMWIRVQRITSVIGPGVCVFYSVVMCCIDILTFSPFSTAL